jgi:pentapeptide MXKDX repeat protein
MFQDRDEVLRLASRYLREGDWARAAAVYRRLLETVSDDWEVHNLLGDVYAQQGAFRDACVEYMKTAQAYEAVGATEMAVALYKKILRVDSNYHKAYASLAKIYEEQGYWNEALQAYQKLADYYFVQGVDIEAWKIYNKICELNPDDEIVRTRREYLKEKMNMKSEVPPPSTKTMPLTTTPSLPGESEFTLGMLRDYRELARIHWESGEVKEAVEKVRIALEKNPADFESLELLGKIYLQRNQWENALLVWEKLVRLNSLNPQAQETMADILLARGRKTKARSYYGTSASLYEKGNQVEGCERIRLKISSLEEPLPEKTVVLAKKALEKEALAKEALEKEALAKEALKKEALAKKALEKEALAKEALEKEALAKEALKKEALAKEALKKEALAKEALEKEALAKEALKKEALAKEALEKEALAKEALEKEALAKEALEKEALAKETLEKEALAKEALEKEALEKEQLLEKETILSPSKEENLAEVPTEAIEQVASIPPPEQTVIAQVPVTPIAASEEKSEKIPEGKPSPEWELKVRDLYEKGILDEAIRELQKINRQENSPLCWKWLGICFAKKGMHNLAVRYFLKAKEKFSPSSGDYSDLQYQLGLVYEELGDYRAALKTLQEISSPKKNPDLEKRIGNLQRMIAISEVPTSKEELTSSSKDSVKSEPEEEVGKAMGKEPNKPDFLARKGKSKISFL